MLQIGLTTRVAESAVKYPTPIPTFPKFPILDFPKFPTPTANSDLSKISNSDSLT